MKDQLMKMLARQSDVTSVEAGFDRPADIANNCTTKDLYSLKMKIDTALSHFIDEYDWTCSRLKLIAEATVCWYNCAKKNLIFTTNPTDTKYNSDYVKSFFKEMKEMSYKEFGSEYSKSNKLSFLVSYSDKDVCSEVFLTENILKFIISKVNEVVTDTLDDGSCVDDIVSLNQFLDQAIPCWEYMKKQSNSVFVQVV